MYGTNFTKKVKIALIECFIKGVLNPNFLNLTINRETFSL